MDELPNMTSSVGMATVLWIWGAAGTCFLIGFILDFYKDHLREEPRPAETYATKAEVEKLFGLHADTVKKSAENQQRLAELNPELRSVIESRITEAREDERKEAAARRLGIYTKIDATSKELRDEVKSLHREVKQDFTSVHQRLDELTLALGRLQGKVHHD